MIALFDADSLFYLSCYKIYSFKELLALRRQFGNIKKVEEEIIEASLHRFENMTMQIIEDIEETGWIIDEIQYFVTSCTKSIRKEIEPNYKANRKGNPVTKYANKCRSIFEKTTFNCSKSDEFEADDLIADKVRSMNESEYIIVSMDKDVLKLKGFHYNFYRKPSKPDEPINARKGLGYTSLIDHQRFFAFQMLVGDNSDNIKGIKGIGEKNKHIKELSDLKGFSLARKVVNLYEEKSTKEELRKNFRLIKLGK